MVFPSANAGPSWASLVLECFRQPEGAELLASLTLSARQHLNTVQS